MSETNLHILISLLISSTVVVYGMWNYCEAKHWVPYRLDGRADVTESFFACVMKTEDKPGWVSSHQACQEKGATLAWWTHWKELLFYYDAFQEFKQTLSSVRYSMVFMNLRDRPFPDYYSFYSYRNSSGSHDIEWNYDRESMIKVKHRRYVQSAQRYSLDLNCAAFRMEYNDFMNSDIEFVPCHENTYKDSLVFDIQNDMEKIICRKSRRECPAVEQGLLGSNVRRVLGMYKYHYRSIRARQSVPKKEHLVNTTHCHLGCETGETTSSDVRYFTGDLLQYWCEPGYRTVANKPSHEGEYAECTEQGTWDHKICRPSACGSISCENGGVAFSYDGSCICDCLRPYTGPRCADLIYDQRSYRPCSGHLCKLQSTCVADRNHSKGYHCDCKGSVGEFCEFELNECSSNPCAEGSLCLDKLNGYECVCDPLKQGVHCNEVIPYCKRFNEPCKNGAQCFSCNSDTFKGWCERDNITQYICNCRKGFTGYDCSLKIMSKIDAWQIFAIVLGCMLFVIVSLFCEIVGSRRRHDHDNLQILLESIDGYLKQREDVVPKKAKLTKPTPAVTQGSDCRITKPESTVSPSFLPTTPPNYGFTTAPTPTSYGFATAPPIRSPHHERAVRGHGRSRRAKARSRGKARWVRGAGLVRNSAPVGRQYTVSSPPPVSTDTGRSQNTTIYSSVGRQRHTGRTPADVHTTKYVEYEVTSL